MMNKECTKSVLRIFSYSMAIGDIGWINYARKDYTIVDNISNKISSYILSNNYSQETEDEIVSEICNIVDNSHDIPGNFINVLIKILCNHFTNTFYNDSIIINTQYGEFKVTNGHLSYKHLSICRPITITSFISEFASMINVEKDDNKILTVSVYDPNIAPHFTKYTNDNIDIAVLQPVFNQIKYMSYCMMDTYKLYMDICGDPLEYYKNNLTER